MDQTGQGIDNYSTTVLQIAARIIQDQRDLLIEVARRMAETIQQDKRIFLFGSGHSHLIAEEAFYRAGGLAAAVPIFSTLVMLHENPELASHLERTPGLAKPLLDRYTPQPGEMIFIISNSGVNQLPVEAALYARELGLFIVSICSLAYARVAPLSPLGLRLDQASDLTLDNGLPPGDALVPLAGDGFQVGPGSTVLGALLWNCLVSETAIQLQNLGAIPPVFGSYNMPGGVEHNQALLDHWRPVNPHL